MEKLKLYIEDIFLNLNLSNFAHLFQRLSGILLTVYLFGHMTILSSALISKKLFDQLTAAIQAPLWHLLDIGLIALIIFHGVNGLRITIIEFGRLAKLHKVFLGIVFVISAVLFVIAVMEILPKMLFGI